MNHLYNIFIKLIDKIVLPLLGIFSDKIKRFKSNRVSLIDTIENEIKVKGNEVWFHAASLGEYEMAVPLIKKIKEKYSSTIILTFFSESGFQVKKRIKEIDYTFYLPLDTTENAKNFITIIKPKIAIFIKLEIWPNFLKELKTRKIKTYLVESTFRDNDKYLSFPLKYLYISKLKMFSKIFTVDSKSKQVLGKAGVKNIMISGSLKVERALTIAKESYNNQIIEKFKGSDFCIVCGSTWKEDEKMIFDYINNFKTNIKWIIAPHDVSKNNIKRIKKNIHSNHLIFSDINKNNIHGNILILNTIGHLKNIYKYADLSYVGGGMGNTGLHNILEACVFEIPVVVGKNYKKFNESIELVKLNGLISVKNQNEFDNEINKLITNQKYRTEKINNMRKYFNRQTIATNSIIKNLSL